MSAIPILSIIPMSIHDKMALSKIEHVYNDAIIICFSHANAPTENPESQQTRAMLCEMQQRGENVCIIKAAKKDDTDHQAMKIETHIPHDILLQV